MRHRGQDRSLRLMRRHIRDASDRLMRRLGVSRLERDREEKSTTFISNFLWVWCWIGMKHRDRKEVTLYNFHSLFPCNVVPEGFDCASVAERSHPVALVDTSCCFVALKYQISQHLLALSLCSSPLFSYQGNTVIFLKHFLCVWARVWMPGSNNPPRHVCMFLMISFHSSWLSPAVCGLICKARQVWNADQK